MVYKYFRKTSFTLHHTRANAMVHKYWYNDTHMVAIYILWYIFFFWNIFRWRIYESMMENYVENVSPNLLLTVHCFSIQWRNGQMIYFQTIYVVSIRTAFFNHQKKLMSLFDVYHQPPHPLLKSNLIFALFNKNLPDFLVN